MTFFAVAVSVLALTLVAIEEQKMRDMREELDRLDRMVNETNRYIDQIYGGYGRYQ